MAKALAEFTVKRAGEDYLLLVEDEDGTTTEYTATFDQLDEIADAIDEAIALGDEDELIGGDEDEDADDG